MAEFEARAVNENGTLSRSFGLFGDLYENLLNAAGIETGDYGRHAIEALEASFDDFRGYGLAEFARRHGGRDGVDEDYIHDAADEVCAFLKRLRTDDRGFCSGSPPRRPRYTEGFTRQSWER